MSNHRFGMKKILAATALTMALTACGGDSAEQHLSKASGYLAENNQNAAIIELKNAIKKDAALAQARLTLGEIYLERGNYLAAEKELNRALELNAEKEQVIPLLARTYLNQGQPDEIGSLLSDNRPFKLETETELLAIHALALFRNGQIDQARTTLSQAQELGIEGTYSKMVKASISAADQQLASANETINQLSEEAPNNTDVWLLKGHLASLADDNATAVLAYQKAVELAPEAVQFTLYLAQAMVKNKQFDEAEPYLNNILKVAPNHMLSNQLKAYIRFQAEDFDAAFELSTKALQNGSHNTATQIVAGISAYKLQKYEQALTQLERVINKDPNNALAQRLYVTTQFRIGQLDSAFNQLNQPSIAAAQDSDFLSTVSLQLNRLGRTEEAIQIAEKAAQSGGLAEKAKLGLLKLKQNDLDGIEILNEVLAEQPNHAQAFLGLQTYSYQQGNTEEVLKALNQWIAEHPADQSVKLFKGAILEQQERYDEALSAYQAILKDQPNDVAAKLFSSSVYVQKGEIDKAYQLVYEVKIEQPENLRAFEFLMSHASQIDKIEEVKSLIDEQLATAPESTLLTEQLGRYYLFKKDFPQAITTFEKIDPMLRDDRVWQLIGDLYLQAEQQDKAVATFKEWLENSPLSLVAYVKNINILEAAGKLKEAVSLSTQAMKLFKTNQKIIFVNSVLQLKAGDAVASQDALDQLEPFQLETPAALQQQGYIYLVQKNWPAAIETFDALYKKYPSTQTANLLIKSYKNAGNIDQAISFIKSAMEQHKEAAQPLQLQLAELQMQAEPNEALAQYHVIIEKEPENVIALNNLAWVYHEMGKPVEALLYAEKAHILKPDIPQVTDTYGYMLLKAGKVQQATVALEQSYQQQASNEIALHYVEALIADQQTKKAKGVLDNLRNLEPELTDKKAELEAQLK
ncbi:MULTISPECIES: XrtA/PEP-CTERM system TPR-repeat protein PrsT [unclassified Agarivorans]|uniref:XrtA/PEP-CTERM system TPR-repeat protein PrsT n=1 Tax=unclassified Agarivorans TaxID=2636026 RepID=UPI0026E300F7|nr:MULTISPECIES: XrtA/PEP-CTERM system TPR-repeat protein PrsT [unclassified Agarivorans]MDO6687750.1 PEP-CTERM system TPR-repeat protein PrsT [Agarivorans sp. 3_MG-2023]MDO6717249.1 PEP-CTERM system TPR-repeat protein PrsT [Agarivorans sp. 2_MG-2023]